MSAAEISSIQIERSWDEDTDDFELILLFQEKAMKMMLMISSCRFSSLRKKLMVILAWFCFFQEEVVEFIRCSNCGKCCPKDNAIKRFVVRNIPEQAAIRYVQDEQYSLPKLYAEMQFCESCAIHSFTNMRNREPLQRFIRRGGHLPLRALCKRIVFTWKTV